jgi:phenylalanyl-tRNA synthetase beta chain
VVVEDAVSSDAILARVRAAASSLLRQVVMFDVYRGPGIESGRKSVALGLILQDKERTLTDEEVDRVVSAVRESLSEQLGAQFRQ